MVCAVPIFCLRLLARAGCGNLPLDLIIYPLQADSGIVSSRPPEVKLLCAGAPGAVRVIGIIGAIGVFAFLTVQIIQMGEDKSAHYRYRERNTQRYRLNKCPHKPGKDRTYHGGNNHWH